MGKQIDFLFENLAGQIERDKKFPDILMGTRAEKIIQGILKSRNKEEALISREANNGSGI